MEIDHFKYEPRAVEYLASQLTQGTLVLFLGAGASLGAGLPDWEELVKRLRNRVGLPNDGIATTPTADQLQAAVDDVRAKLHDEKTFARSVKDALYDGVTLSSSLLQDELLIAIGALMMGSRRGRVSRVLTFNFDSILEWYIHLYGFMPNVILQPPSLEGAEDVRIYHPHGFVAHPDMNGRDSDFVILGLDAVNERLGTTGDPWFELTRHVLRTGVGLFVGASPRTFDDRGLAPLLVKVAKEVNGTRPTAFWVVCDEKEPLSMDDWERLEEKFLRHNVVPIRKSKKRDVPGLLLSICQKAAAAPF